MNHLFISYNLALIAKKKGFNEPCFGFYENNKLGTSGPQLFIRFDSTPLSEEETKRPSMYRSKNLNSELPQWAVSAPTHEQIKDWLRINHSLEVSIKGWKNEGDGKTIYVYSTKKLPLPSMFKFDWKSEDYYKCSSKAIEEAFKLI